MKQKINDYLVLVKNDRKTQIISGIAGFFILVLIMMPPPERGRVARNTAEAPEIGIGAPNPNEAYKDLLNRFEDNLTILQGQLKDIKTDNKDVRQEMQNFQDRTAVIFQKVLARMADLDERSSSGRGGELSFNPVEVGDEEITDTDGGGVEQVSYDGDQGLEPLFGGFDAAEPAPPPEPPRPRTVVITPGDAVRVKLLAGVNAPTDGSPYPVVFKLIGNVTGPDGSNLPLGEARVIAAAQGSLTDSRALYRLTDMSIRYPNGERRTVKVDGWIVGEDGIRGMKGRLIDHLGRAITAAVTVGAAEGAAQAFSQSQVSTTTDGGDITAVVTGDNVSYVAGQALAQGANRYGRLIEERVRDLVPVVEILSGREATAVFAKTVEIEGLYELLEDSDAVYASLD